MLRTMLRNYVGVFMVLATIALMLTLPSVASAAPANDNFADAQTISGRTVSVNGTNTGATTEVGEPSAAFADLQSVWYRWTAPASAEVTMDTCSSNFDTVLSVYTGSALGSLTQVAANDDYDYYSCGRGSRLNFDGTSNTTYYIRVAGYGTAQGNFTLNLQQAPPSAPPPPNDTSPTPKR